MSECTKCWRLVTTRSGRHDSFQHVSTRLDESRLEVTRHKSQKNLSKPKHGTRHTMYYSVCKQMICFKPKSADDSTYLKSSRKRKRTSCLPEVKLMDVGVYKMLTTRHDSIGSSRLVPTRVDSTRWKSIGSNSTQVTKKPEQTQAWYKTYYVLLRVHTNDMF